MFVCLFCSLRLVSGEVKKWRPEGSDRGFTFLKYNLTRAYHRTNLLARYGRASMCMFIASLKMLAVKPSIIDFIAFYFLPIHMEHNMSVQVQELGYADSSNGRVMLIDGTTIIYISYYKLIGENFFVVWIVDLQLLKLRNRLPSAPPRKNKEKITEVEQQLKKADAAERHKMQNEKASRESEAKAIRKILGQDSSSKKREDKLKKRQEELAQEKAASAKTITPNII
ncbi:INO80 complex subunit B isoform X1 [Tanacetum coccineum]